MPRELRYVDAVRLLGGSGPLSRAADAKSEVVRLGEATLGRLSGTVRGLSRYDRSEQLQAAHAVLVVTAFFEELDDLLVVAGLGSPASTRDFGGVDADWLGAVLAAPIPAPNPARGPDRFLRSLRDWFAGCATRVSAHLAGLEIWDGAAAQAQRSYLAAAEGRLPRLAVDRYEAAARKLAGDLPEFALWTQRPEAPATSRGLQSLETTLLLVSSRRDLGGHRAALATAYRARLHRPLPGGRGDVRTPSLGDGYRDPRFRARSGGPTARPADESWWAGTVHDNLARFLAVHLTAPAAADAPMLLLGEPGAGKSAFTRVLAARLPAADFLTVRVAADEVPAGARIEEQIEQAVRSVIGETVPWAALADEGGGALPVVLLDGFDEVAPPTGAHGWDYLARVAAFQQREASLGRPVAVVVTCRSAVAARARLPVDAKIVRLEPVDDHQTGNEPGGPAVEPTAGPGRPGTPASPSS